MVDFSKPMMDLETGAKVKLIRHRPGEDEAVLHSAGIMRALYDRYTYQDYQEQVKQGITNGGMYYSDTGVTLGHPNEFPLAPVVVNVPDIAGFCKEHHARIMYHGRMTLVYVRRNKGIIEVATTICRSNETFLKRLGAYHAISNFELGNTVLLPDSVLAALYLLRPCPDCGQVHI